MKYLIWLLKAAVFFTLFAFALNNQSSVQVRLFFGAYWQAPLVLVLLATLAIGAELGILVMVPVWLRAKRHLAVSATPSPITEPPADHSATTVATSAPHGL